MKVALLDARQGSRNPANSSTVAYRNMLILAKELCADLFVSSKQLVKASGDYDAIICGFGSTSTERTESVKFLQRNEQANLFWLVGEYEQSTFAPLFYAGRQYHVLRNYDHPMKNKQAHAQTFVNLNALLAGPAPDNDAARQYGAVYYGRWREDRSEYFARYLQGEVMLSTSPKNMKVFAGNKCNPKYARALSWANGRETLRLFSASLYIEDRFTHTHYNCPANRFYEAIKCGVTIVAQQEAKATFDRYGIELDQWRYVSDAHQLHDIGKRLMNDDSFRRNSLATQREWGLSAVAEKSDVIATLKRVIFGGETYAALKATP